MNVMQISFINNFNIRPNISQAKSFVSFGSVPLYIIDENGNASKYASIKEVSLALGVSTETIRKALEQNKKVSGVTVKKATDYDGKK